MIPDPRYERQTAFHGLGPMGQERLAASTVLVCGAGGTGGTLAALLVRAGVGRVRVVDRDRVELSNLHRQLLYDEGDVGQRPKALIAGARLAVMNRAVQVEARDQVIDGRSILDLCQGVDLILDALDNLEGRYVINDAAVKLGIPWVHTGCLAAHGNLFFVVPGQTPCLRCIFPEPPAPGSTPTAATAGVLGPTPALVASLAAMEAIKWLSGARDQVRRGMLFFNLWENSLEEVAMGPGPSEGCPCCGEACYSFLT